MMAVSAEKPLRLLNTDAEDFPFSTELHDLALDSGTTVVEMAGHDADVITSVGADCDGILVYRAWVDAPLLERLPRCRVVARCGTGYERIDVAAAAERGVVVTYVPDFCNEEMSDMVLLFVLAFARGLPVLFDHARRQHWPKLLELPTLRRLAGRRLAVLGFGNTGRRTVEKAVAIGLDVVVWSRRSHSAVSEIGGREVSFEEALASDFVSLHLPLTVETNGLIGDRELSLFDSSGILINTARGAIVSTDALVEALRAERLGGAGLDVVEPEPLPAGHPLWSFPNVVITSHTASLSVEAVHAAMHGALVDAIAVLRGEPARFPVQGNAGARST